ncbi:hypothetical protein [Bacillus sp. REN3]|uniref:hypothetical protein n=1 Tax=Bacillus sp. REN3 TaxID=2802440 RepID=UPI001AEEE28A|nr:hypothetical protein [Bacillus sp. REN3]
MRNSKSCHHRFSAHEENVGFPTNDGIDVFVSGARFQKHITCDHIDLPVEPAELIETSQIEKRNNQFAPKNLYETLMNL